ncbi:MAG: hypothetical protein WBA25_18715 [Jannaschia sp.]
MTKAIPQNIRLALLIVSILAGIAVQKHEDSHRHAGCGDCIETSRLS